MATNPRWKNGALRRKYRQRFKAIEAPCRICGGPINYDDPSDPQHPLSLVIDEIIPISKWELYGYNSAAQAAQDPLNIQPAHYRCNQLKGNKTNFTLNVQQRKKIELDGKW